MNKVFLLLFCFMTCGAVNTAANNEPSPFEKIFPEIGYKTVEEALGDLESHYMKSLTLPLRVPPIAFTHQFGRFSDLDGELNDSLEVKFISNQSPENHYKIDVRPVNNKLAVKEKYVLKSFVLRNGEEAKYMTISGFNVLVFEDVDWQYMLSIDKRGSNHVTPEVLVDIANSIHYSASNPTK